jgi:adenylate cyclase class 2
MEVCFDSVEGVGEFVELEILAVEAQYDAAKATLFAVATELGLTEKEPRSYLAMTLEAQKRTG